MNASVSSLKGPFTPVPSVYEAEKCRLEVLADCQVALNGKRLTIGNICHQLLSYFVQNQGRVITVLDIERDLTFINKAKRRAVVFRQTLSRLRKELNKAMPGAGDLVHTIRPNLFCMGLQAP